MMAILSEVQTHRHVIRTHALRQSGNWGQVFYEAEMMARKLRMLQESLSECWDRLYHLATYNGLPREEAPCDD